MNTQPLIDNAEARNRMLAAQASSPLDLPTPIFTEALERRKANRAALLGWIKSALVEGSDYGKIHSVGKNKCQMAAQGKAAQCQDPAHWSKPSLWKPGAEKICGMLGVTAHFPTLSDYEAAAIAGTEVKTIILRCQLKDGNGRVVAEGVGARNIATDYGDFNKALKMAEKSAMIDSCLRMAGLSEIFTQDLEDMQIVNQDLAPSQSQPRQPEKPPALISKNQFGKLRAAIQALALDEARVLAWCQAKWGIREFMDLTFEQWRELVGRQPLEGGEYEPGKLHQFRAKLDQEPITEDQLGRIGTWLGETDILFEDIAKEIGLADLRTARQGQFGAIRDIIDRRVRAYHRAQYDQLPEEEKERRARAAEAAYMAAEEKAGRSGTRGT